MPLKTPHWWYKKNAKGAPFIRYAALPLSWLWQATGFFKRLLTTPYPSSLFVISVGNVTLGGSGKTPIERELLRRLKKEGLKASGLTRGYGGSLKGPIKVDPLLHSASEVGDEALMLAHDYDIFIAQDRAMGLQLIETSGQQICVVDDVHQNLKIHKNVHILVVDADTSDEAWPFGDGHVFPVGPMREPLSQGLKRADIVVLWLPSEQSLIDPKLVKAMGDKPTFVARLVPMPKTKPSKVLAYAGIAKPWKFKATLLNLGYDILDFTPLADHKSIDEPLLKDISVRAKALGAKVITTEKDWVKLAPEWRHQIEYLPISARFDDQAGFMQTLLQGQRDF
jgi:tetraacyldisaccharide 4'-kinase